MTFHADRQLLPVSGMLLGSLAVEIAASVLIWNKQEFVWLYHGFVFMEYGLLAYYFSTRMSGRVSKWVLRSIPAFVIWSLGISIGLYHFGQFPALNINSSGLLLVVISVYRLFHLEVEGKDSALRHTDFWFGVGILIFFGGTFFSNALYSYLYGRNPLIAKELFAKINHPLNILYYCCLLTGLLCSIPRKSFSRP